MAIATSRTHSRVSQLPVHSASLKVTMGRLKGELLAVSSSGTRITGHQQP
jgi:hypothetical protein